MSYVTVEEKVHQGWAEASARFIPAANPTAQVGA